MLNTFIQMMASINDPVAIERGYQILSAKRDLLAANSNYKLIPIQHQGRAIPRLTGKFKVAPSFTEACMTAYTKGEWLLELTFGTPQMHTQGFINGSHWRLLDTGYEYSSVEEVKTGRKARIRNKYLKSVFVPA